MHPGSADLRSFSISNRSTSRVLRPTSRSVVLGAMGQPAEPPFSRWMFARYGDNVTERHLGRGRRTDRCGELGQESSAAAKIVQLIDLKSIGAIRRPGARQRSVLPPIRQSPSGRQLPSAAHSLLPMGRTSDSLTTKNATDLRPICLAPGDGHPSHLPCQRRTSVSFAVADGTDLRLIYQMRQTTAVCGDSWVNLLAAMLTWHVGLSYRGIGWRPSSEFAGWKHRASPRPVQQQAEELVAPRKVAPGPTSHHDAQFV